MQTDLNKKEFAAMKFSHPEPFHILSTPGVRPCGSAMSLHWHTWKIKPTGHSPQIDHLMDQKTVDYLRDSCKLKDRGEGDSALEVRDAPTVGGPSSRDNYS
jgi:hypothetical protein